MDADKIESTQEDLKAFESSIRYWTEKLGLSDWDFIFKIEELEKANAAVRYCDGTRKAAFRLAKNREPWVSIEVCARHETLELLLADIALLLSVYFSEDLVNDNMHRVINRLMPVLAKQESKDAH